MSECAAPGLVDHRFPGNWVKLGDSIVALLSPNQKPTEYGYAVLQTRMEQSFNPAAMAPKSAESRRTAIAKWREWRAKDRGGPEKNEPSKTGDK